MNFIKVILFASLGFHGFCVAGCKYEESSCYLTNLGLFEQKEKMISGDEYSHLMLNGKEIFKTKSAYMVLNDDNMGYFKNKQYVTIKLIISFVSFEPCLHNEYYGYCNKNIIADFSDKKPVFSNIFISDSGNSVINWVSWGKKNAIIVFEDGSRFKYENGRVERITGN